MNFENFITSQTGFVHFFASILALALGTLVLWLPKGTKRHMLIGRMYGLSMFVVLFTAFMIYQLFGTWGIFHWTALVSSLTLILGLIPILTKWPTKSYLSMHYSFMYWSVMGVYGAFVSETLVRMPKVVVESGIPNRVFYNMTGIGTALVMGIGVYFFLKFKPRWDLKFQSMK